MSNERWEQIKQIFSAAMERHATERKAFVEHACGDDMELRREVESLLTARTHGAVRTAGVADAFAGASTASIPNLPLTERVGAVIGPYKLLQPIGEGGFGTVFLADQTEPVRRRVALKIIKLGMDTRQVVARFEAERQALAIMDHPHIARVLDGGATPVTESGGGQPYFVMEYVVGDAITKFADAHALTVRDRLDLFQQVCSAVQHAHTKGVIHRDLKPGNVLASMVDGKPFAKVIDFGIAKATAQLLTAKTLFTEHRQLVGTPEYMSPEQAEGSQDIDTRTDVYSLGVLLYELLTGDTPIEGKRLRSAAYDEMRRMIREEEPLAPSMKISRSLGTLAAAAAARKVEPSRLSALVKGELDWIVLKALEKDRARRYETPNQLAADVQRQIAGEAVVAAPPSAAYRLRKFVRRNKGAVVGVTAVMLALAAGGSVAAWQWVSAQRANTLLKTQHRGVIGSMTKLVHTLRLVEPDTNSFHVTLPDGRDVTIIHSEGDTEGEQVRILPGEGADPIAALSQPQPPIDPEMAMQTLTLLIEDNAMKMYDQTAIAKANAKAAQEQANIAEAERVKAVKASETIEYNSYVANVQMAGEAMDNRQFDRVRERLDACPERLRGWEWKWLNATSDTSLAVLKGHRNGVQSAAFSPDGTRIVTASWDSTARVWDAATGAQVAELKGHTSNVYSAAFSPDGTRIVTSSGDSTARVWDAATGAQVAELKGHTEYVYSAAFSPDGTRIVTSSWDKTARVWDAATGASLLELKGHTEYVHSAAFSPDGTRIVTLSLDKTARVWDAATGASLLELKGHTEYVHSAAFSPDGTRIVTSSWDKTARVWDAATGASLAELKGHTGWVTSAAFSPDGTRIVTASEDMTARVWDASTGASLAEFRGHTSGVRSAAFSPDGTRIVTVGTDDTARVWDAYATTNPVEFKAQLSDVFAAEFSSDGSRIVTGGYQAPARVWDAVTGASLIDLKVHASDVTDCEFSPDGTRVVTTQYDGTVRVWDSATGLSLFEIKGQTNGMSSASFSPDGTRIATASFDWSAKDTTAKVLDASTGASLLVLSGHQGWVRTAAFSPDGTRIVTASGDITARVWDAATGASLLELKGHTASLFSGEFSPDGTRIVTAAGDGTARVWDAATGVCVLTLDAHSLISWSISSATFSPDGTRIITTNEEVGDVWVWDTATGSRLAEIKGSTSGSYSAKFSPDGTRIVIASVEMTAPVQDSVPYRERFPAIAAMRAARAKVAGPLAARMNADADLDALTQSIGADAMLSAIDRTASLAVVQEERDRRAAPAPTPAAVISVEQKLAAETAKRQAAESDAAKQREFAVDALAFSECATYDTGDGFVTIFYPLTAAAARHISRLPGLVGVNFAEHFKEFDMACGLLADPATGHKPLTDLQLFHTNKVTDETLNFIARADTALSELAWLSVSDTSVTDAGLTVLAGPTTGLKNLTELYLSNTSVTNVGLTALARADSGLKNLTTLDLTGTKVTDEGIAAVKARFPNITITR